MWCDVVLMNVEGILHGRPWMYNKNEVNQMQDVHILKEGDQNTLHTMKLKPPKDVLVQML